MTVKYEVIKNSLDEEIIQRTDDNGVISFIPKSEGNSDYQRYLRHLAGEDESGTLS